MNPDVCVFKFWIFPKDTFAFFVVLSCQLHWAMCQSHAMVAKSKFNLGIEVTLTIGKLATFLSIGLSL